MRAKRQHHVSQCYLKGFAASRDKPKLFVADWHEKRYFTTAPANVAAQKDFHTVEVEGQTSDAVEKSFSDFETVLDPALRRIAAARSIADKKDRALLLELVAILAVKNPRSRKTYGDLHSQLAKMIMDIATSTPERWAAQVRRAKKDGSILPDADVDYDRMRDFVERGEFKIETPVMEHLRVELPTIEKLRPLVSARKWILFRAPPGSTGFITSDHPVCLMWSDPAERGKLPPPGFGLTKTQVLFPVTRELAMLGAFEAQDQELDADDLLVAQINGSIFLHATRQVYARDGGFSYILSHSAGNRRGDQLLEDQCFSRPDDPGGEA